VVHPAFWLLALQWDSFLSRPDGLREMGGAKAGKLCQTFFYMTIPTRQLCKLPPLFHSNFRWTVQRERRSDSYSTIYRSDTAY